MLGVSCDTHVLRTRDRMSSITQLDIVVFKFNRKNKLTGIHMYERNTDKLSIRESDINISDIKPVPMNIGFVKTG